MKLLQQINYPSCKHVSIILQTLKLVFGPFEKFLVQTIFCFLPILFLELTILLQKLFHYSLFEMKTEIIKKIKKIKKWQRTVDIPLR